MVIPKRICARDCILHSVQSSTIHINGWEIGPADRGCFFLPGWSSQVVKEFILTNQKLTDQLNRLVVELTVEGRYTTMLVPITLLNNDL